MPPGEVLHPDIQILGDVLNALRNYLVFIPWQKMEEEPDFSDELRLHPAHAAVVMRRYLLSALTDSASQAALDIELRTTGPRDTGLERFSEHSHTSSAELDQSSTKSDYSSLASAKGGGKRKRSESGTAWPTKRQKTENVDPNSDPAAVQDTQSPDPPVMSGSVLDLSQKIWKDLLWYSSY